MAKYLVRFADRGASENQTVEAVSVISGEHYVTFMDGYKDVAHEVAATFPRERVLSVVRQSE
jgi:hypothetical protein